jgi:hypothetical protein
MALVTLSALAASLTTRFRSEVENQINRATVLMHLLPKGDNEIGAARAEGADVVNQNNDDKTPATLEFGNYDDAFGVTGKALRAAAAAGNPEQLAALFAEQLRDSMGRLAKGIAIDLYTGSGATNFIHGLLASAGPLAATGTYANILRSSFPQWASTVFSNGGIPRQLDKPLMRRVRTLIYTASGMKPDLIVCSPRVHEQYGNTFTTDRRYMQDVRLRGQTIALDGGWSALEFDGIPVIEDVDCTDGVMLFLTTSMLAIKQLPDIGSGNPAMQTVAVKGTGEEQLGDRSTQITARVNSLSRNGDKVNMQLISYLQLQCRRPNACGVLTDLLI